MLLSENRIVLMNSDEKLISNGTVVRLDSASIEMILEKADNVITGEHVIIERYDNIDGVFKYKGVISYVLGDRISCSNLELISNIQRRQNVKIKVEFDYEINQFMVGDKLSSELKTPISIHIRDISAGGMFFVSNELMGVNQKFLYTFDRGKARIDLVVEIIRLQSCRDYKMGYGCKFLNVGRKEENILNSYIFTEQIKQFSRTKR